VLDAQLAQQKERDERNRRLGRVSGCCAYRSWVSVTSVRDTLRRPREALRTMTDDEGSGSLSSRYERRLAIDQGGRCLCSHVSWSLHALSVTEIVRGPVTGMGAEKIPALPNSSTTGSRRRGLGSAR
jgi:hypothetical protein